jgi:FHS family L-fucose permease-like MFS transporter
LEEGTFSLKQFPQLGWGMLAIFTYVGVEVTIQSNLGALLKESAFGAWGDHQISPFIALYWGSLMIGRWSGALSAFGIKGKTYQFLLFVLPVIAFLLVIGANYLRGSEVQHLWPYLGLVILMAIVMKLGGEDPRKTLTYFGLAGVIFMGLGLILEGQAAVFSFISGGLWCSIMWPCIFALAIKGLGKFTSQGSSLLIMMILGGAIIPPFQGWVADHWNLHYSYLVPLVGFVYLAYYGMMRVHK